MEKLTDKYNALIKCENAFLRTLKIYQNPPKINQEIQNLEEILNASVIKHFELLYETFLKYLKLYLYDKYGLNLAGSKTMLRACYDLKLIDENELLRLFDTVEIRSATTHM